ncbi:MAG: sugar phosphate isomerase/epimerase [bacterium]|nr:sugar phosphate isomerase/epimerase [bacterium]
MHRPAELVVTYWSMVGDCYPSGPSEVSPVDFRERVEMAHKVGYSGIGFVHADILSVSDRLGFDTMKKILDDNGMTYVEVEIITDWFTTGEKRKRSDAVRADLLSAAEKLGAWHIKIGGDFDDGGNTDWPIDGVIRDLEVLSAQAADVGTRLSLEVLPFSNLRSIDQGVELFTGAKVDNGGLLLDIWHMERGGIDFGQISRMPKGTISWVELNDALAEPQGSLYNDTIHNRVLPGEGSFDIQSFLQALSDAGYDGPYGVEILSEYHRTLPLEEQAVRGFEATMNQLEIFERARRA